jgi:rhomboid protease GluP
MLITACPSVDVYADGPLSVNTCGTAWTLDLGPASVARGSWHAIHGALRRGTLFQGTPLCSTLRMTAEEALDTRVGVTASEALAREWALVLTAGGIEHRLEPAPPGWTLVVSARNAAGALAMLGAYDAEQRADASVESPPAAAVGGRWLGALVAALLVAFFVVMGPRSSRSLWFERGSASTTLILGSEPWRAVTALTLHADLAHVLSNALACILLVTAVGRSFGAGVGLWLVLLAGAGGNALTALAHGSHHVSVGASTSIFGALGVLGALQVVARRRRPVPGRRPWVVVAASLLLLALLGTAVQADVVAHVFGLIVGGALGLIARLTLRAPPGPNLQMALLLAAALTVIGCWVRAVSWPGPS